jgi:hypothetical protein
LKLAEIRVTSRSNQTAYRTGSGRSGTGRSASWLSGCRRSVLAPGFRPRLPEIELDRLGQVHNQKAMNVIDERRSSQHSPQRVAQHRGYIPYL